MIHRSDGALAEIESYTTLTKSVFSHLNSFCQIVVMGHRRLSLAFSPCGQDRIDVLPSDYPIGRPVRTAYFDGHATFHVVEATSGEKGPYRKLANGSLFRGETLGITVFDEGKPICKLTLADWSAQAGIQLSPTAGWGLPVNAIEFKLSGDQMSDAGVIYITLAGTSIGRGWDSVGHSPGTYRNQMRIEHISEVVRGRAAD
jgi:hypothetical protein